MKIFVILFCVILSSCAGHRHSKITSFTPASVVVDYTDTGDLIEATDQAQRYCGSMGKDAQYVNNKESSWYEIGGKHIAFFNCIAKPDYATGAIGSNTGNVAGSAGATIINNMPPAIINNSK